MTSEAPFLHCRLCGARYRSDKVIDHEKQCSYQSPDSRRFSAGTGNPIPASSKDSRVNKLLNVEQYYKQETSETGLSANQPKDSTSNEESADSPLNKRNSGSSNQSPESNYETETKCIHEETSGREKIIETKTYCDADGRVIKTETQTTYFDPDVEKSKSKTDEALSGSPHNNVKFPPKLSSTNLSSKLSKSHEKSHSNEKKQEEQNSEDTYSKKSSPTKSDKEEKKKMANTPYPSEEDIKMQSVSAAEVSQAVDALQNFPELTEAAEMAFEKHQETLVPCVHCERNFRPDRLPIHERACIERPKARECIVPEDVEKKNKDKGNR